MESSISQRKKHHNARALVIESQQDLISAIQKVGASPHGTKIMSEKGMLRAILLEEITFKQAIIIKQEMLSKGGDAAVHAKVAALTGDYTDVLLMGTLRQLQRAAEGLMRQPFGLRRIGEEILEVLDALEPSAGDRKSVV